MFPPVDPPIEPPVNISIESLSKKLA